MLVLCGFEYPYFIKNKQYNKQDRSEANKVLRDYMFIYIVHFPWEFLFNYYQM